MLEKKLNRFILLKNGEKITETPTIRAIAKFVGCSFQYLYKKLNDNKFKYKKNVYTIIDKLDSIQ